MKLFKNALKIWFIGTLGSAIPFGYVGIVFGCISVLISTLLVTLIFKKELS